MTVKLLFLLLMLELQTGGAGHWEGKNACKVEDDKDKLKPMSSS